ncbi:hypothetical protein DYB26_000825 [Aphanomyces astaci]|uniref:Uncharacterized protein n=1 Tax=Aphanomyces astaci TaxID=112090 RepID=A0A418EXT5_APHAT|nr:hypothetical protein DYB26_000825 [Aphanomyces astaci]
MGGRGVTAVALVIPSLYALYGWYKCCVQEQHDVADDDSDDIAPTYSNGPVSVISAARIDVTGDTHVRFPAPSRPSHPTASSPPLSTVLYTSRGDVAVNVQDDNLLSNAARDYFSEVTDVSGQHQEKTDHVTLRRSDFDAMMGFVANHLRDLPPHIALSTTSYSIAPGTSLGTMLSNIATTAGQAAITPLSQIILLVDDSDMHSTYCSSSGMSVPPPKSSVARDMVQSYQASRGLSSVSNTVEAATLSTTCHHMPATPPTTTTLVHVKGVPDSRALNQVGRPAVTNERPASNSLGIWDRLFGSSALQNNADQSYFVFH